jgi:N-acyl-D-aspartate/D-glutamate deacylase
VRERQAFTLEQAVRMLTLVPATHWSFADRGLVREGVAADLVVFDPDTIAPDMPEVVHDLPAGARRLVQRARGIAATVVNGGCCCATASTPARGRAGCCGVRSPAPDRASRRAVSRRDRAPGTPAGLTRPTGAGRAAAGCWATWEAAGAA